MFKVIAALLSVIVSIILFSMLMMSQIVGLAQGMDRDCGPIETRLGAIIYPARMVGCWLTEPLTERSE